MDTLVPIGKELSIIGAEKILILDIHFNIHVLYLKLCALLTFIKACIAL